MTKEIRHVAVVGAGGMGALFGAILSEGGLEVTLIDTDREHMAAIRDKGLCISGLGGDRRLMLATAHDATQVEQADIVLVQCKGTATREVALAMTHLADTGAVFISFQNGSATRIFLPKSLGWRMSLAG